MKMKFSNRQLIKQSALLLLIILITYGCDTIQNDSNGLEIIDIQANKLPGSNFAIDLDGLMPDHLFKGVNSESKDNVSISNSDNNFLLVNGAIDENKPFQIEFESKATGETVYGNVFLNTTNSGKCNLSENFTEATFSNDEKLTINLFENEDFCDLQGKELQSIAIDERSPSGSSISSLPVKLILKAHFGFQAVGEEEGDYLTYTFDPDNNFTGEVQFEYVVGINNLKEFPHDGTEEEKDTFTANPNNFEFHTRHMVTLTITN